MLHEVLEGVSDEVWEHDAMTLSQSYLRRHSSRDCTVCGPKPYMESYSMNDRFKRFIYGENGTLRMLDVDHIQLREKAGVTKSSMSEYLRGVHRPSKATAEKVAGALGLPLTYVLSQIDVKEPKGTSNKSRPSVNPTASRTGRSERRFGKNQSTDIPPYSVCSQVCLYCQRSRQLRAERLRGCY
jgi:transcriptional regulator with XRE-family HTH domain